MGIKYQAQVSHGIQTTDIEADYTGGSPTEFVSMMRMLYGRRLTGGTYDDHVAAYRTSGNAAVRITLVSTSWPEIEDGLMNGLIETGRMSPADMRALDEVSEGGVYGAFSEREEIFAVRHFCVGGAARDDAKDFNHVCLECVYTYMHWSQRGQGLGIVDGDTFTCDVCRQQKTPKNGLV